MKFLKKHFTKFIMAFTLAFTCFFVSFGCNTYAFSYDTNTNTFQWDWQEFLYKVGNSKIHCDMELDLTYNNNNIDITLTQNFVLKNNNGLIYIDLFDYGFALDEEDYLYYVYNNNFYYVNCIQLYNIDNVSLNYLSPLQLQNFNFNLSLFNEENVDYWQGDLYKNYFRFNKVNDKNITSQSEKIYSFNFYTWNNVLVDNNSTDIQYFNNYYSYSYVIGNTYSDDYYSYKFSGDINSNSFYLKEFLYTDRQFSSILELFNASAYYSTDNIFGYLSNKDFYTNDTIDLRLYNDLESDYQDYQNSHSYTNQQYNDLESDYQDYQNSHSYTNQQYNDLESDYQSLDADYSDLQSDYNSLETALTYQQYGWLMYVDNLDVSILNGSSTSYSFNQLVSGGYLSNGSLFKLYDLSLINNPNYTQITFEFYFNDSVNNLDTFNYSLLEISTRELFGGYIYIYDDDNNVITFNVNDVINIDSKSIDEKNANGLFNGNIYEIKIVCSSPDNVSNIYTNNFYGMGYQQGRNSASYFYEGIINELNNKVDNLINTNRDLLVSNNNLTQSVSDLQSAYNTLNQSYQNMLNGNNFASLFFTIAETPFASFKQIWNIDFLGVNLAGFVTGILFLGLIIWVIKKIF